MRRFGVCGVVLLGGLSCAEPLASVEEPPACEAACDGAVSCELSVDPACRFREPGPWFVVESMIDSELAPLGARGELYAFPSALGHVVTPIPIGRESLDDEFWVSWSQYWSPDGAFLLYDSCNGFDDISLECRLFTMGFGEGLPGEPRRVENLPQGTPLFAHEWSVESNAFTVSSNEELYLVRREGNEFVPSFITTATEVGEVTLCAGGEYALHDDRSGTVTLLRTDGDDSGHLTLGSYYSTARVSADARWIVTSSANYDGDEPLYSLFLRPCGEGDDIPLFENGAEDEFDAWFSPDSRYLTVEFWLGEAIGYIDLKDGSFGVQPFPEDVVSIASWSDSTSFLVVGASDGSAFAFRPETQELIPIGEPGRVVAPADSSDVWPLGEIVEYDVREPETGDVTRVELYDPLLSTEPLATFEPDSKTFFGAIVIDDTSTHVAYTLEHSGGEVLKIVDLSAPEAESSLFLPGAFSLWLEKFSYDGRAVVLTLSQPEFGQYWVSVPAPGQAPELRVLVPSEGGTYVGEQPWP